MKRIPVRIILLAVITTSSGTNDGKGLPSVEPPLFPPAVTPMNAIENGDHQLSHGGSASKERSEGTDYKTHVSNDTQELNQTNDLTSGNVHLGSFGEDHMDGGSYTRLMEPQKTERNHIKKRVNSRSINTKYKNTKRSPKEESALIENSPLKKGLMEAICAVRNCDQNSRLKDCPETCKEPKDKLRVETCNVIGCGVNRTAEQIIHQEEILKTRKISEINVPKKRREEKKQRVCPNYCSAPQNYSIERICTAFGCFKEITKKDHLERKYTNNQNTESGRCPESCKPPQDSLIAHLCQQIGCVKEIITQNISETVTQNKNCPDICNKSDDELNVIQCMLIGCKTITHKIVEYTKIIDRPNVCPDFCNNTKDTKMIKICHDIDCMPCGSIEKPNNCPMPCKSPKDQIMAELCGKIGCLPGYRFEGKNTKTSVELDPVNKDLLNNSENISYPEGSKHFRITNTNNNTASGGDQDKELQLKGSNIKTPKECTSMGCINGYSTHEISRALISEKDCPERCMKKDGFSGAICILIECQLTSLEEYRPNICRDFCFDTIDSVMIQICQAFDCKARESIDDRRSVSIQQSSSCPVSCQLPKDQLRGRLCETIGCLPGDGLEEQYYNICCT